MTALPLPTEAECQTAIIEAARAFCYRVHHQRPARLADGRIRTTIQGDKGWPDLVIAGHGRCWAIELKRPGNPPSPEQVAWITALCAAGIDARVLIVPTSQQAFIDEIQRARSTR